jgi:hypothetical protein
VLVAAGSDDATVDEITRLVEARGAKGARATATALVALFQREMEVERVSLQAAMLVRDEDARNTHRRTRMFRAHVVSLMLIVAVVVLALLLVAIFVPVKGPVSVSNERLWVYGFLLGSLGGALSALQRTTSRAGRGRLPELQQHKVWMWSRPVAGGAAGLVSVPLALAGVIPIEHTVEALLATAFVAGFSERLIVRAAGTMTPDGTKQTA